LVRLAVREGAVPILVAAESKCKGPVAFTKARFFDQLGGPVASSIVLEPAYTERLSVLAENRLPANLVGRPDELFEIYVHAGLQFLFQGRVQRYGQDRRFEVLPDGFVETGSAPLMLYDCKAAHNGYTLTRDSIRQFSEYVKQFHERYDRIVGRLHSFLVFSSQFQDVATLRTRSSELYVECQIQMVCITAECLGKIVQLFAKNVEYRKTVDWRQLLVSPTIEFEAIETNLATRQKDGIVHGS